MLPLMAGVTICVAAVETSCSAPLVRLCATILPESQLRQTATLPLISGSSPLGVVVSFCSEPPAMSREKMSAAVQFCAVGQPLLLLR